MSEPIPTAARRLPPRLRLLALVLTFVAGVAGVATVGTGVASAAPPLALTATPNPVVIPLTDTYGFFTLGWSTGSAMPAELTYSIDGGPESARVNQTATGTTSVPIAYGQTQVWRLYTKGLRAPLKSVTVTTRRPDQSCKSTCLKDVKVTPHGTFADVKVIATAKLKTFELTAHKPGEATSSAMIGWDTQTWNTMLLSLDPGSDYQFNLKVTDESGNSEIRNGTFTTLKRQVAISFDSITVTDDSDDLSEGDLKFWFDTDGAWDSSSIFSAGVDTGDTVHPGYSTTVTGAPDILELGLYGWDDDCGPFTLCSYGSAPGTGTTGGSNSEADWAYAFTDVNTLVSGPGESFSAPFSVSTSGDALAFDGSGTYSVTYI